jgi:enamine deaminase RidA (YjgF/YER057c/UK114 family)
MNAFADILEAIAHAPIEKRAMTNHGVLNEAYAYAKPSSFSRGMRIDIGGVVILLISGTASIDENGVSVHIGDFPAQLRRTFDNITGLLESEGAPGTTLCAPVATCATSIATTTCSTRAHGVLQGAGARSAAGFDGDPGASVPAGAADRD